MLLVDVALEAVLHEVHDAPAVVRGGAAAGVQAELEVFGVVLVYVPAGAVFLAPVGHAPLAGGEVDVEENDEVGPGEAELHVFEVIEPVEEGRLLSRGQLRALVDGIAGRVAVGEHHAAILIILPPVGHIRGVAVDGVEYARRAGVDVLGLSAEVAV